MAAAEDDTYAPDQTTNYETSDDPSKYVDTPAGDGQGSRHNYTVIGQVGHTYDHNLLAMPHASSGTTTRTN